jgi:hypothetical protein
MAENGKNKKRKSESYQKREEESKERNKKVRKERKSKKVVKRAGLIKKRKYLNPGTGRKRHAGTQKGETIRKL